jgi:hypothetical protein
MRIIRAYSRAVLAVFPAHLSTPFNIVGEPPRTLLRSGPRDISTLSRPIFFVPQKTTAFKNVPGCPAPDGEIAATVLSKSTS